MLYIIFKQYEMYVLRISYIINLSYAIINVCMFVITFRY